MERSNSAPAFANSYDSAARQFCLRVSGVRQPAYLPQAGQVLFTLSL